MTLLRYLPLICMLLGQLSSLSGATLHLCIVADTEDQSIGETVGQDVRRMLREGRRIAEFSGLDFHLTSAVTSTSFILEPIMQSISDLEVDEDDVIFFYYSGHGFRNASKRSRWPVLFMGWNQESLDMSWVIDTLLEKQARFTIVMGDCCNSVVDDEFAPAYIQGKGSFANIRRNYERLFREASGVLIAAGCDVGEYSYCNQLVGGFFTNAWFRALGEETQSAEEANWAAILSSTYEQVSHYQHPIWLLEDCGLDY